MDFKFARKPIPRSPYQHRRAQSEAFFQFPDLNDILLDNIVMELNLDLPPMLPLLPMSNSTRPEAPLRSLSMDVDFVDGLGLDGQPPAAAKGDFGRRYRYSNSMDGYSSTTSFEVDCIVKKAMALIPLFRAGKISMVFMQNPLIQTRPLPLCCLSHVWTIVGQLVVDFWMLFGTYFLDLFHGLLSRLIEVGFFDVDARLCEACCCPLLMTTLDEFALFFLVISFCSMLPLVADEPQD